VVEKSNNVKGGEENLVVEKLNNVKGSTRVSIIIYF